MLLVPKVRSQRFPVEMGLHPPLFLDCCVSARERTQKNFTHKNCRGPSDAPRPPKKSPKKKDRNAQAEMGAFPVTSVWADFLDA